MLSPQRSLAALLICASLACAQSATLRGVVTDPSGSAVPKASVTLKDSAGKESAANTGSDGSYEFQGLAAGDYTLQASAPQLTLAQPRKIAVHAGAVQTLNLPLTLAAKAEQVTVAERAGPVLDVDPANAAGAVVLRGNDLQALSDDPDDLAADLQALAGPSAGPNGGQIFIDGFSGGELPPKESIREIRINSNPFSEEYDALGYGRVEVFTKPGTDKLRGTAFYNFGDDVWNSRNPYSAEKAPFMLKEYGANLSGPLGKRASFTLDVQRHAIDNGAIINGSVLDPQTFAIIDPFTQVFRIPQRRVVVTPRLDYQVSSKNTLTARYSMTRPDIADAGIGSFNLVSQAYDSRALNQTVQLTDTQVVRDNAINETAFQYYRASSQTTPRTPGAALQVLGAFTGGGAPIGSSSDLQNSSELRNSTSWIRGRHSWKFGVRMRGLTDSNSSRQNFDGTFTFGGGQAPELDPNRQPVLDASGNPVLEQITSLERYQRTLQLESLGFSPQQIRALGGGASQFTLSAGNPLLYAGQFDVGVFAGDDWRVRPNFTLSLGLRYETQTNIEDRRDFAPRIALAWAPGGSGKPSPKTVIRAGFGMFYDRFGLGNTIAAQRYNGRVQQQYVIANPDFFPAVPSVAALAAMGASLSTSAIQEVSAQLRAPYLMQSAVAVERQLPASTTLSVTYANTHGLHQLRSQDINAPLPGTFNPQTPGSGVFPFSGQGPVFLMESSGLYNQNQLIVNVNSRINQNFSLTGSYVLNRSLSNTDGVGTFPSNPYSMAGEYGPALSDIRHRVSVGGSVTPRWGIQFSPLVTVNSGPPFDITTGQDLYGDTLFNSRPGFATDPNKPGVIRTKYGLLDPNPAAEEHIVPRNFGRGPGIVMVNLRVGHTFMFGPPREGGSSGGGPNNQPRGVATGVFSTGGSQSNSVATNRRYGLAISVAGRNIINHNNPGPIVGNIASPLFGVANQPYGAGVLGGTGFSESADNRRFELQTRFTF